MKKNIISQPLHLTLKNLLAWFKKSNFPGIIIGGMAVSFLGSPRTTQDIDALVFIDETDWKKFLTIGKSFNFQPRIKNVLEFAEKNRVLLIRHQYTKIDIDISFGILPFEEETIKRAKIIKIANFNIPLPTPEDLIIMKSVAHRPIDLEDIRCILKTNPKIDKKRIEYWLKQFSEILEKPEIWLDIKKLYNIIKT
ncbi:MAG: nucleotidyltransferase [Candidatus Omnitrophica bacterium]|nr:nucleotidyltransferase [Candidatus Omnitrophota bacterium]